MPSLTDLLLEGREIQEHRPWPRVHSRCFRLEICGTRARTGPLELVGALGRTLDGAHGDDG